MAAAMVQSMVERRKESYVGEKHKCLRQGKIVKENLVF
jgi:hypothetical protein